MNDTKNLEFFNSIFDMITNEEVLKLEAFTQHAGTTRLEHCVRVSKYSYLIAKFLHLDYISAARAGLCHDFYLYDWRNCEYEGSHSKAHAKAALENTKKHFTLNKKEEDAIVNHMWPMSVTLPKTTTGWIVQLADKIAAIRESSLNYRNKMLYSQQVVRFVGITLLFNIC
ncbi:MAG: HD domain-containing protein [Erysipelotrichia bacterium]|nr:HD domain-containing protein [Erysipelotrichia bacterium]NCC55129.1 HD domain-containing protein [Erysipelotrichia bacterium]